MKTKYSLVTAACALLMALPLAAASTSANPAKAPAQTQAAKTSTANAWPAETLSGTIVSVNPNSNLVVVKTSDGIPFDFDISRHTRINAGSQAMTMKDLAADVNKTVSVKFVPERRGDVAESIQLNG